MSTLQRRHGSPQFLFCEANEAMRFTVRNMLWATFWFAVWGMSCFAFNRQELSQQGDELIAFLVLWWGCIGSPILAVSILFRKTRLGIVLGIAVALALYL